MGIKMKIRDIESFVISEDLWEKHHTNRKSSYYFNENYTVVYTFFMNLNFTNRDGLQIKLPAL